MLRCTSCDKEQIPPLAKSMVHGWNSTCADHASHVIIYICVPRLSLGLLQL